MKEDPNKKDEIRLARSTFATEIGNFIASIVLYYILFRYSGGTL